MRRSLLALFLAALTSCSASGPNTKSNPPPVDNPSATAKSDAPPEEALPSASEVPPEVKEAVPAAPLATDAQRKLDAALVSYLQRTPTRRIYTMVDKPIYQPGETIWFSTAVAPTTTLIGAAGGGLTMQLVSPRGNAVLQRRVIVDPRGIAANDFPLPAEIAGGEYTLKATCDDGATDERKVIVASYEAPRFKKSLELTKKGYGPGEPVSAAVSVARATGEPLANKALTAAATVDDVEVWRAPVTTDAAGNAVVRFTLPAQIERGDALLTVTAEDAGVSESVQKRIPVILKKLEVKLYPEGGDLVAELPSRVYVSALNPLGKPAEVQGKVVDDQGHEVQRFASLHDGMGRFAITPRAGRTYHVEVTRPTGIAQSFALPAVQKSGCTLQSVDDFDSQKSELKVAVWCSSGRSVVAEAVLRETRVASQSAQVLRAHPTVIALPIPRGEQGAVRVTLMSDDLKPLAERLIYRGRGDDLKVKVSAGKPRYSPRDPVELTIETHDGAGRPVEAAVGVAVVDDAVLSYADDKTAGILAHLYLDQELGEPAIEEPNYYFGDKKDAAAALDLVLGTRGWRRFDWQLVWTPPVVVTSDIASVTGDAINQRFFRNGLVLAAPVAAPPPVMDKDGFDEARKVEKKGEGGAPRRQLRMPVGQVAGLKVMGGAPLPGLGGAGGLRGGGGGLGFGRMHIAMDAKGMKELDRERADDDFGGENAQQAWQWSPVRQFPVPDYSKKLDGPIARTDFRETIYWNPEVATNKDGKASVKFYLSDAVTSFRATVEGRSLGGLPGRGESTLQSKLPLSLDAKVPLEVSSGDTVRLPVTIANESDHALDATLKATFGAAFELTQDPGAAPIHLQAGERRSVFYPLNVVGMMGEGEIAFNVDTNGLHDELKRTVRVVPVGFPEHASFSGTVEKKATHEVDLGEALPRTVTAQVTLYPSPLTTMLKGAEGMLREPSGCFEQTSSSNYPNVMVSQYLTQHDVADPQLIERAHGMLDRGYKKLTGYESPKHGYEWFGSNPGHEALTAYGLMEFHDMESVYGSVDHAMLDRTVSWLYSRRDGKGGYLRNPEALDSFGGAPPEVTNAYITWALTEAGKRDIAAEIGVSRELGKSSSDPYLVALAANTALNAAPKDPTTAEIVTHLLSLQGKDGGFPGAKTSITRSGGEALAIESAALAELALVKADKVAESRATAEWLSKHDNGYGAYGSTQSTVLAIKALDAYSERSRKAAASGVATVYVNGKPAGKVAFDKGRRDAIVFDDLAGAMTAGKNTIEIRLDSQGAEMPYAVSVDWRTQLPHSSQKAKVQVETHLARDTVKMGETVRLHAHVENVTKEGQPMALARIGLPGGLTFQTWQLKELRDKKLIDFYETRQREVILYFRAMAPSMQRDIDLDLMAMTPGSYTAPASSAYLYYTNEHKYWAAPSQVTITE